MEMDCTLHAMHGHQISKHQLKSLNNVLKLTIKLDKTPRETTRNEKWNLIPKING